MPFLFFAGLLASCFPSGVSLSLSYSTSSSLVSAPLSDESLSLSASPLVSSEALDSLSSSRRVSL